MSFAESFADIRRSRDYSYHVNYTEARQLWQDEAIQSTIPQRDAHEAPWLVYTCGPMGVGKGYVLGWLSKHSYFPLEGVVHVDPDQYKMMMPEWPHYVQKDKASAGSFC